MLFNTASLLILTAVIELGGGILLLVTPSLMAELLLGVGLASPASLLVGRIAGAALLSIGLICWLERNRSGNEAASGLIAGLLVYNAVVVVLLTYAAVVDRMNGIGIWPGIAAHTALLIACAAHRASSHVAVRGRSPR